MMIAFLALTLAMSDQRNPEAPPGDDETALRNASKRALLAEGRSPSARGQTTSGAFSTAFGFQTRALGDWSTAFGSKTTADGQYSTVMGFGSETDGAFAAYSIAMCASSLTPSTRT